MSEKNNDKAIRAVPCWTGNVEIAPLGGGITNRNYRANDRSWQQFQEQHG